MFTNYKVVMSLYQTIIYFKCNQTKVMGIISKEIHAVDCVTRKLLNCVLI
jgi:hypothetical protein